MTLEFEKLTDDLDEMVRSAGRRQQQNLDRLQAAEARLHENGTAWARIERCLTQAREEIDVKFFRAAAPLSRDEPLDQGIAPPVCPTRATILASDGSQILPDRHAAYLYYLINVGIIVYHHGAAAPPDILTRPTLAFPREEFTGQEPGIDEDTFTMGSGTVSVNRDLAEIGTLASKTWELREAVRPLLAILDQRLLYWPVGVSGAQESTRAVQQWQAGMTQVRDSGGWLAGYIDRPGKSSVMTLLDSLDIERPDFDKNQLTRRPVWQGPTDVDLFGRILRPGQRSAVFVDVSDHNDQFKQDDPQNQVCFFYLNSGRFESRPADQIARVDIPMWVAQDPLAVANVHALLYDQCEILGGYPYVLTRADEIAVVGRRDQQELDHRIALRMESAGLSGTITAKQQGKEFARGGKSRHEI